MRSKVTVSRTTLRPADAVDEAFTSIASSPLPSTAISIGSLLAVGWFVSVLGLVSTASGQVASQFAGRLPTTVLVTTAVPALPDPPFPYPRGTERRLDALAGVVGAGEFWRVTVGRPVAVSAGGRASRPVVIAGTPGYLAAAGAQVSEGRLFDSWDQAHAAQLCLVGSDLARTLGLARLGRPIHVGDAECVVSGIVARADRQPILLRSVVLPSSTAAAMFGPPAQRRGAWPEVLIATRPGAASVVARQAPYAINPDRPRSLTVSVPAAPIQLRQAVTSALDRLFSALGWIGLAVGALAIAGLTLSNVAQRTPEYALRRALGARRRHIAAHVLTESVILGLLGGLAGASLGVAVIVLVARAEGWTPVVAPLMLWPAPLAGAAAGMIAGVVPAIRAAFIRPSAGLIRFPTL